jgi:hypothetical protein
LATFRHAGKATRIAFAADEQGRYNAMMNHDYQNYHEEDAIAAVLDVMEIHGWSFKYDSESQPEKRGGASYTQRELFIFHKLL